MFQKVSLVGELVCKFSCVLQIEHYFLLDIIPLSSGHCGQNHNSMSNMATSFWIIPFQIGSTTAHMKKTHSGLSLYEHLFFFFFVTIKVSLLTVLAVFCSSIG